MYLYHTDDTRLKELDNLAKWFQLWESSVSQEEKKSALMTKETREDTMSVLKGFGQLCQNHFKVSDLSIVPARVNSDIVENLFCQQRALLNGANDNPTLHTYATGINTIILSRTTVSQKSNSWGSANPFKMENTSVPTKM